MFLLEIGFRGIGRFLDRINGINRMGGSSEVGLRQAAVPWRFGQALHLLLELCVLRRYFVPVFHQFCVLFGVSTLV